MESCEEMINKITLIHVNTNKLSNNRFYGNKKSIIQSNLACTHSTSFVHIGSVQDVI